MPVILLLAFMLILAFSVKSMAVEYTVNSAADLETVVNSVYDSDSIKLLADIVYGRGIVVDGKSITFDLNNQKLTINNTLGPGLHVRSGGEVKLAGTGSLDVVSSGGHAIFVESGGKATVTSASATADDCSGAYAEGAGSEITVIEDATAGGFRSSGACALSGGKVTVEGGAQGTKYGAYAKDAGSNVSVAENAVGTAIIISCGAYAVNGGTVHVAGRAEGGGYGAYAEGTDSEITVAGGPASGCSGSVGAAAYHGGKVTVAGNAYGAWMGVAADHDGSRVEVTGDAVASRSDSYGACAGFGAIITIGGKAEGGACGVWADSTGSTVTVAGNAVGTESDSFGAFASGGGMVIIGGHAQGDYCGAYAEGTNSRVEITGSATGTGNNGIGAKAETGGWVTVLGNVSGVCYGGYAVGRDSTLFIAGDVRASGTSSVGLLANNGSMVAIDGIITAPVYIMLQDVEKTPAHGERGTALYENYKIYTDGTNVVRVKIPAPIGGGRGTPASPTYTADVSGISTERTSPLSITVNTNAGNATTALGTTLAKDIFAGTGTAVLTVPVIPGVNSYTVEIPAASLSGSQGEGHLTFSTGEGSVTIPVDMLEGIPGTEGKKARITIARGDKSGLPDELKAAIGDRPVVQLTLTLDGRQTEWNNPNAPVTVSIPYTPTAAEMENPESIVVWYIDGSGNVVSVPNGRYNPATGTVTFTTTHFSYYAVAYVHKTFSDLGSVEWARKPIEVMASKGIINGTGKDTFSPAASITRADYLVLLIKTLGLTAKFDSSFEDAEPGAYYYEALGIAKTLGIASGNGDRFMPAEYISRQDMMVLTARALEKYKGLKIANDSQVLDRFKDKADIAFYAVSSFAALVEEGLVAGSRDNLNPRANTTRAEAAVFLYQVYTQ